MPNPKSGTFDLGDRASSLVVPRLVSRSHAARPLGRVRKTVRELAIRFLVWRAKRETLQALSALDAATLRDLGITDIESAVNGAPQDRVRGCDPGWWLTRWC
jgi:uncharacterized protein YjiS (DUF1127 family)